MITDPDRPYKNIFIPKATQKLQGKNFDDVKTLLIDNQEVQTQMTSFPFSK